MDLNKLVPIYDKNRIYPSFYVTKKLTKLETKSLITVFEQVFREEDVRNNFRSGSFIDIHFGSEK